MNKKLNGILVWRKRHADHNLIIKILSDKDGLVTLYFRAAFSKKNKKISNALIYLASVSVDAFFTGKSEMGQIRDIVLDASVSSIATHMGKQAQALFLAELLFATAKGSDDNSAYYNLALHLSISLDSQKYSPDFHLIAAAKICNILGFKPSGEYSKDTPYFHFTDGHFSNRKPGDGNGLLKQESLEFGRLFGVIFDEIPALNLTKAQRTTLLRSIEAYLAAHIEGMTPFKTLPVLMQSME